MASHSKILDAIFRHSVGMPDKTAIYTVEGIAITYRHIANEIKRAANFLIKNNVRKGDRIIISAQKEIEFIYLYFGAHLIGAVNVVVDSNSTQEHLDYISKIVEPVVAFGIVTDTCWSIQYVDLCLGDNTSIPSSKFLDKDDPADIMFTSGTTGTPKGVVLSHFNIFSSADNINNFIGNTDSDIELLGLPVCHSFGLGRLRCNMLIGATVVMHNGFANLRSVFSCIERYGVTGFGMVPAVWAYIKHFSGVRISKYANQIRYIEIGSASMLTVEKESLCELFPTTRICMHYGLTEASRAVFMEFHENRWDLTTIGRSVVPDVDVKIIKENGGEAEVEEEGEICIRGNMVTKGYYNCNDNQKFFWGEYFRTGDWGRKSANGNLYLVARKKELINVGGKKVSPVEIEEALERVGVGESMCVAIPDPDGLLGEVPKALLVRGSFNLEIDVIKKRISDCLETYKLPRVYEIVDSIPKTSTGKKQRTI